MALKINVERARNVGRLLSAAWNAGGVLGDGSMPEDLTPAGVEHGSPEHALFLTLTVAIDYMRNADQLWDAARMTYGDPHTHYLFNPVEVTRTGLGRCQDDLIRYGVVKKQMRDTTIWTTICLTLCRHFGGRVEPLLAEAEWSGPKIIALIRSEKYRDGFPNLKGPKIAPLWVRMLKDNWQGHELVDMDKVELPVDVHTGAATVMTGCVGGSFRGRFSEFAEAVWQVWREGCERTELYPLQLDEPLWHLSRGGCRKTVTMPCEYESMCPVAIFCTGTRLSAYGKLGQLPNEVSFETGVW